MPSAYYGLGNASSLGFGLTAKQPNGLRRCFGLWARDKKGASFNPKELQILVETI